MLCKTEMLCSDGRVCVVVAGVRPQIDCSAFAAKRIPEDMFALGDDHSRGDFLASRLGNYQSTVEGCRDAE